MKKSFVPLILIAAFFAFGCGLINKSQSAANDVSNLEAATPTPAISKKPEAAPSPVNSADRKNLLSLGNGSFVVAATSESSWKPHYLIDEIPKSGWASGNGKTANQSITIELTAKTTLETIVFDTEQVENDTGAKNINVEVSDTSATDGFQEILAATLKNNQDGQEFPVQKTIGGRWLRINFISNYGSAAYVELMDIHGYGEQETPVPLENISGTYESSYGNFHIKQEGTSIVGCYDYARGVVQGGIENRMMKLNWQESRMEDTKVGGPALMFFSQDGKTFLGLYGRDEDEDKKLAGQWNGKKISDKVGFCEHYKTLDASNAAGNKIEENLEKTGRAVVYGINFDFNSDVIKNESKPTLDQIAAILTENKDWKMTIEGHTDNVGGDAFNKTLSEKRANSVKTYLVGKGIEAARLSASGMGMSKPVAQNETEAGRAQNRRVELVKQ